MQSVGTKLREARVSKGLSIDDINALTRINSKNLSAIESDQVQQISSPFFYRSFVRQYADLVGLDFQVLSPNVESLACHMRQPDLPGQGEHQIVRVAPIQARVKRDWSWLVPAVIFFAIIALGSGGFAYVKFIKPAEVQASVVSALYPHHATTVGKTRSSPEKQAVAQARPVTGVRPSTSQTAPALEKANANVNLLPDSTSSNVSVVAAHDTPIPAADKIRLELAATEPTWLSVSADGKPAYTGTLEAEETKVLEGQETALLRTGNAGGVNIIFNGKAIGAIGPRGTTRTIVFSKTGYAIEAGSHAAPTTSNHIGG